MKLHTETQGSPEWAALRSRYYTASNAAAMKGCHPTKQRNELLREMKTGIAADVSDFVEARVFAPGHATEAAARPLAEAEIGEDLYPLVGSIEVDGLPLLASFDGLTLDYSTGYEHKLYSEEIATHIAQAGEPPLYYVWQLEQQLLVSGGQRILFVTSDGTPDKWAQCWYTSKPERRAKLIAGWQQFAQDLAGFVPTAAELPKPTGRAPEALPALRVEVTGMVTASNLAEFKAQAMAVFGGISRDLKTDEDFANAEATAKWAKGIEDKVAGAKDAALAQTGSIDDLFRTMDEISAEARRVRLDLDKLVKARKEAIKGEIVAEGVAAFAAHIRTLNAAMPANYMPQVPADFGGCIKNLRTVDSIRNAVSTELANAKIRANEFSTRIQTNIGQIDAASAPMLFADMATLVLKQPDDLAAVISQRLAAEQQRKEAERERIRAEEAARLEREAEAARKDREALELLARKREQDEADRIDRLSLDTINAVAERTKALDPLTAAEVFEADADRGIARPLNELVPILDAGRRVVVPLKANTEADDGARMTLGEINARIAPVSITVAGLSLLGYEPVAVEKAARLYPASKFPAICAAISAHVLAAPVKALEAA